MGFPAVNPMAAWPVLVLGVSTKWSKNGFFEFSVLDSRVDPEAGAWKEFVWYERYAILKQVREVKRGASAEDEPLTVPGSIQSIIH